MRCGARGRRSVGGEMREYLEWQQDGGRARVRIHRRVLAGLEREEGAGFNGALLGTVSPATYEVLVEDYVRLTPGGQSLPAIGYFRLGQAPQITDEDRAAFLSQFSEPLNVLLLF